MVVGIGGWCDADVFFFKSSFFLEALGRCQEYFGLSDLVRVSSVSFDVAPGA